MRWCAVVLVALTVLVTARQATSAATSARAGQTVWDGVYTREQADAGQVLYRRECAHCHLEDLSGENFAPGLRDDPFIKRWENEVLASLFAITKTTMPQDRPASLSDEEYAAVVAYLLSVNKFPAGQQKLSPELDELKQIAFRKGD